MTATSPATRLTGYAHGGGCACKIPPGELEDVVRGLMPSPSTTREGELLVGLEDGDDAAAVRIRDGLALIATTDFFTPVVDDPYDWGRIAAANALSDVYAMGGRPVIALNLLCWPREVLPYDLAAEVLRGGLAVADLAGCHVAGGHSVDDPEPKYGMAVTGIADPEALIRNDAARPGTPLTLTKPLGLGVLNNRHKATGESFAAGRRGDDHAQRRGLAGRRGRGHPGGHRHHRLRPARPRPQARAGVRGHRGDRQQRRAVPRRRPRGRPRRVRARRLAAEPRLGAPARAASTSTRPWPCCSPTPRPPAACCSPARSPATP